MAKASIDRGEDIEITRDSMRTLTDEVKRHADKSLLGGQSAAKAPPFPHAYDPRVPTSGAAAWARAV